MAEPIEHPMNHKLHIVLALLTGGIWLIPYMVLLLRRTLMEVDNFFALVSRNQKLLNNRLERENMPDN